MSGDERSCVGERDEESVQNYPGVVMASAETQGEGEWPELIVPCPGGSMVTGSQQREYK